MYTIYADGNPVYAPNLDDDGYVVIDPQLTLEDNRSGTLTFTVPPTNLMYDSFQKLKTHVSVYRDDEEIWYGRVFETQKDFYNRKLITCEGTLSFLCDTIIRPFEETEITINMYIREILSQHNEQVSDENKLYLGEFSMMSHVGTFTFKNDAYETAWNIVQNDIINVYGGHLFTHEKDGTHYLDFVDDDWLIDNRRNSQKIEFGENLLDLTEYISAENVVTVLIPLGDVVNETDTDEDDEDTVATSIIYTDANRVNIKEVNDGKDYLEYTKGIELFGRIWGTKIYDGITDPTRLKDLGLAEMSTIVQLTKTMDISAVDLKDAGVDVQRLKFGYMTNVVSAPHGVDDWFLLTSVKLYLTQPDASLYTLGQSSTTLTESMATTSKSAKASAGAIKTIKAYK